MRVAARVGPRATVVEADDGSALHLDAEGRWSTYVSPRQRAWRRTVDGRVLRAKGSLFEPCSDAEARRIHGEVEGTAARLAAHVATAPSETMRLIGTRESVAARLALAARWPPEVLAAESERFEGAYPEPVWILPPHRYRDLVVQPATGCPNHDCAFCAFYRDRPFRVLGTAEYETHLAGVVEFFGAALAERDGLFLGSASALSLRDEILLERLARTEAVLGRLRRGAAAFLDPDRCPRRGPADWDALRRAGLEDVTVGLETGLPALRAEAGKSGDLARFAATVSDIKAAGIRVALTVLIGLGGPESADDHRRASVSWIANLPLDPGDRVYLSPLQEAVAQDTWRTEREAWRAALRNVTPTRVGAYLIERFAWFA